MSLDALTGLHILVVSPEPWQGLHMSKHHVSQGLVARGNQVVFWGPTPEGLSRTRIEGDGPLRLAFTPHWFKGVNSLPAFVNRWYYERMVRSIEEAARVRFDVIWCFDTSRMQWFPSRDRYRLLHLVDYDILYQGHGLMRSADLIVTTADIINQKVLEIAPGAPVHKVGHALDPRWLKDSSTLVHRSTTAPRSVVYAGQFHNAYIDWEALLTVAREHPGLQFQYIGNHDPAYPNAAFQQLRLRPNVEFTGIKTKEELVPLVREADILMYSFMTDSRMLERANPHKVLEYLSTGNVIMGSWTLEYVPHQHLLVMSPDRDSFVRTFQWTVDHFKELNTPVRRSERITFAGERTIDRLLARVAGFIGQQRGARQGNSDNAPSS